MEDCWLLDGERLIDGRMKNGNHKGAYGRWVDGCMFDRGKNECMDNERLGNG